MTMTSLDPTSRCAIRPSGETFDRVSPGISSVVGRLRDEGVDEPELSCSAGLDGELVIVLWSATLFLITHILGLLGAVVAGVSDSAWPTPSPDAPRKATPMEPGLYSELFPASPSLILPLAIFCGGARLDLGTWWFSVACAASIGGVATFMIAAFAIIEC